MPGPEEFFRRSDVSNALDQLAEAKALTVFCGAGISMDAFLPSWAKLIEKTSALAEKAGLPPRPGLVGPPDVLAAASQLQARIDLGPPETPALGTLIAEALTEPLSDSDGGLQLGPRPGPTISALAEFAATRIWAAKHLDAWAPTTWVTQNFDVLFEDALLQVLGRRNLAEIKVIPSVSLDENDHSAVRVRHLHGYVDVPSGVIARTLGDSAPGDVADGVGIVLTASHFFSKSGNNSKNDAYMGLRLENGPVLFVGSSLTDTHLLGQLYASAPERPAGRNPAPIKELEGQAKHVALVLGRGGSAWDSEERRADWRRDAEVDYRRWLDVGVRAIPVEFPVQVAQFVHELNVRTAVAVLSKRPALVRTGGDEVLAVPVPETEGLMAVPSPGTATASYGQRLNTWFTSACGSAGLVASMGDVGEFQDRQRELAAVLDGWLKDLVKALTGAIPDGPKDDERFTLNLWIRTTKTLPTRDSELRDLLAADAPGITHMALLAAPHRLWVSPGDVLTLPVAFDSSRPAVQAFRRQQPVLDWVRATGPAAGDPQRLWRTDYSIPLFVDELYSVGLRSVAKASGGNEERPFSVRGRLPLAVLSLNSSYGQDSLVYRALTRTATDGQGAPSEESRELAARLDVVAAAASSLVYDRGGNA